MDMLYKCKKSDCNIGKLKKNKIHGKNQWDMWQSDMFCFSELNVYAISMKQVGVLIFHIQSKILKNKIIK